MSRLLQHCPLCDSSEIPGLFAAQDPHYGIPGTYRLVRCRNCALVFLNPMYSDEELAILYPANYYAYHNEIQPGRYKALAKRLLGYWQGVNNPQFEVPGVLLDIGCGAGTFLKVMADKGWQVYGLEINKEAARLAQSKGLRVFQGDLAAANFIPESFDYIRASHSFEHMTRPHEVLDEVYRLLKPDGMLHIAVPNIVSMTAYIFGRNWYHLCAPVHAFSYSVTTTRRILKMHNFQVTDIVFNSHYAGVLGSLQICFNRRSQKKSFEGSLFNNRALRVVSGWIERAADLLGLGDMVEITAIKTRDSNNFPFSRAGWTFTLTTNSG